MKLNKVSKREFASHFRYLPPLVKFWRHNCFMTSVLVTLTVVMAVAVLCPLIAQAIPGKPISQTVLLLGAGALLGPHVAGVVKLSLPMSLLSNLGLAFLFLLAGYEINPEQLKGSQGRRGLATWVVSFAIAMLAVTFIPYFDEHDLHGVASAIVLTTTALGTLMPILQEKQLIGTPVGDAVIAYGTWGELCPVLAMAVLLSTHTSVETFFILAGFALLCVAAAAIPQKLQSWGTKLNAFLAKKSNAAEQVIVRMTILLLVVLVTVSSLFDLDIVLGAFAAGFILRYLIPEGDKALETRLDGIGYGFFIPVFFVLSGAKINIQAVGADPALLVTFIVLLVLIRSVPIVVALSVAKEENHLSIHHRITVAMYCATALPVIVAVTEIATRTGTMKEETASVLVAAGAVSVLVMPLVAGLAQRVAEFHPIQAAEDISHHPHYGPEIIHDRYVLSRMIRHPQKAQQILDDFVTSWAHLPEEERKVREDLLLHAVREYETSRAELLRRAELLHLVRKNEQIVVASQAPSAGMPSLDSRHPDHLTSAAPASSTASANSTSPASSAAEQGSSTSSQTLQPSRPVDAIDALIASVGLRAGLSPTQAKEAEVELRRRAALLEKMRLVRMTQLAELAHLPQSEGSEKSEEQEKEHHTHQQLLKHFLRHDIHDVTSHLDDKDV